MPPSRLEKALRNNVTPGDWYAFLNSRVFLWANRGRVDGLLNAKSYRGRSHDVLTLDTKKLVSERGGDALLSHMNSGNTFPYPHERDFDIFKSIEAYPVNTKGNPVKPVAEFTLHYSVPNISDYVLDVETTKGGP